jgi:hypothetical protein
MADGSPGTSAHTTVSTDAETPLFRLNPSETVQTADDHPSA